jgi:hypothetical protein
MQAVNSNLVMTGLDTDYPQVFWKGQPVPIRAMKTRYKVVSDVELVVPNDPAMEPIYSELRLAGVSIEVSGGSR